MQKHCYTENNVFQRTQELQLGVVQCGADVRNDRRGRRTHDRLHVIRSADHLADHRVLAGLHRGSKFQSSPATGQVSKDLLPEVGALLLSRRLRLHHRERHLVRQLLLGYPPRQLIC